MLILHTKPDRLSDVEVLPWSSLNRRTVQELVHTGLRLCEIVAILSRNWQC